MEIIQLNKRELAFADAVRKQTQIKLGPVPLFIWSPELLNENNKIKIFAVIKEQLDNPKFINQITKEGVDPLKVPRLCLGHLVMRSGSAKYSCGSNGFFR